MFTTFPSALMNCSTEINTSTFVFLSLTFLLHPNQDHFESRRFYKTLQRDPILGRDGSGVDIEPQQASVAAEEVH